MEMMLHKKQIGVIFLFEFKMGGKAAETIYNINNAFGSGTANKHTVQWWFKKFCKGDESLRWGARWLAKEADKDQWKEIIKADPLTAIQEAAEKLSHPFYGHLAFEANWKDEKAQ